MRRVAFVVIASWMALALLVCPVIAKASPSGPASQRPAKIRRLSCDAVSGDCTHRPLEMGDESPVALSIGPFISIEERVRDCWNGSCTTQTNVALATSTFSAGTIAAVLISSSAHIAPLRC